MLDPKSFDARVSALFLSLWPIFFAIPVLLEGSGSRAVLIVAASAALLFLVAFGRSVDVRHPATATSVFLGSTLVAFILLLFICIFRGPEEYLPLTTKVGLSLSILVLFAIMFFSFDDPENVGLIDRRLRALLLALPIFLCVMIVVRLVGGPSAVDSDAIVSKSNVNATLAHVGIMIPRLANLPGVSGPNSIGLVAAMALVSLLHLWRQQKRSVSWTVIYGGMAFLNVVTLIMTEARAAIFWVAFGAVAYLFVSPKVLARVAKALLVFFAISPVALYDFFDAASKSPMLAKYLSRTAESGPDLGVGTGRQYVWKAILDYLGHPQVSDLWGSGYAGNFTTGVAQKVLWIFLGQTTDAASTLTTVSAHNVMLQIVLDMGYAGALLFLIICWIVLGALGRSAILDQSHRRCLLVVLIIMIGTSMTEVTMTIYQIMPFLLFSGIVALTWSLSRYQGLRFIWPEEQQPIAEPA